jgi:hypothetical protein
LLIETDPLLNHGFLGGAHFLLVLEVRVLLFDQTVQRFARQAPSPFQVAANDLVFGGMLSKPPFAVTEELLDLVLAHPVVLRVVEHGDEHI